MVKENEILEGGAILDENSISQEDFILGGDSDLSKRLETFHKDNPKIFYNQAAQKRTRNACTLYAAIGLISDMYNYIFSLEEILEICDIAEKDYGWKEAEGGYLHKAIDCVRNYWNAKYPEKAIISFRVDLLSDEAQKLADGGKTMNIGYRTTVKHYKDSQDNGKMDSETFSGEKITGGHAIRYFIDRNLDNYEGLKKYNTYENKKLKDYVKEGTYFRWGYVYFPKQESEFPDVPMNHPFYTAAKFMKENGFMSGYQDGTMRLDQPITRGELCKVFERAFKKKD